MSIRVKGCVAFIAVLSTRPYRSPPTCETFLGCLPDLANDRGFMFMTFETSMSLLREWQVPEGRAAFVAGLASGTVSKALVFPLDTVRRRLQVQGPRRNEYIVKHIPVYRNSFDAMTSIARVEGVRRLYYGLGVSLVKSAPNA